MGIMEKKMETTVLGLYTILVPFLGTPNIRCRIIMWIQTGTIILTTTHLRLDTRDALEPSQHGRLFMGGGGGAGGWGFRA